MLRRVTAVTQAQPVGECAFMLILRLLFAGGKRRAAGRRHNVLITPWVLGSGSSESGVLESGLLGECDFSGVLW